MRYRKSANVRHAWLEITEQWATDNASFFDPMWPAVDILKKNRDLGRPNPKMKDLLRGEVKHVFPH